MVRVCSGVYKLLFLIKMIVAKIKVPTEKETISMSLKDLVANIQGAFPEQTHIKFDLAERIENNNAFVLAIEMDKDNTGYIILPKAYYEKVITA